MMISVNLRPGIRRGGKGRGVGVSLGSLRTLGSRMRDPLPALAVLAWVGAIGFLGWTFLRTGQQLGDLEPRLDEARAEHQRFQDFLQQKRREEATRDSLLSQIRTIREVDDDRYVWPHILDEVARALPPYTWLVDLSALPPDIAADTLGEGTRPPVQVQLTGRTVDIQGYTRFMRLLEDSPWLADVTAVSANTVVEQGRAVTAFVLKATYTAPDSGFVRRVPVAESLTR